MNILKMAEMFTYILDGTYKPHRYDALTDMLHKYNGGHFHFIFGSYTDFIFFIRCDR